MNEMWSLFLENILLETCFSRPDVNTIAKEFAVGYIHDFRNE